MCLHAVFLGSHTNQARAHAEMYHAARMPTAGINYSVRPAPRLLIYLVRSAKRRGRIIP